MGEANFFIAAKLRIFTYFSCLSDRLAAFSLPAAPFVIAAYGLMFLVMLGYVAYVLAKLKNTEKKLSALEEHLGIGSSDDDR